MMTMSAMCRMSRKLEIRNSKLDPRRTESVVRDDPRGHLRPQSECGSPVSLTRRSRNQIGEPGGVSPRTVRITPRPGANATRLAKTRARKTRMFWTMILLKRMSSDYGCSSVVRDRAVLQFRTGPFVCLRFLRFFDELRLIYFDAESGAGRQADVAVFVVLERHASHSRHVEAGIGRVELV